MVKSSVETGHAPSLLKPEEYCSNLRNIKYLPRKLYFLGNKSVFKEKYFLAVVGTRKATPYGKRVLRSILPEIARRKIVIVSGLAKGIDGLAHETALEHNCPTVAVMAGGLDQIYPPEHKKMADEIIKKRGIIVSENPPGTQYLKHYFPARNRIVSGISDATLVIEAGVKSGALITANFAFSQGRKVLAVPGSVFSPQSRGVNGLFKKGAITIQSSEDVLEALYGRKYRKKGYGRVRNTVETQNFASLRKGEKWILENIPFDKPIPISLIIRHSGLPAAEAMSVITQLEIYGLIENSEGGYTKIS